MVSRKVNVHNPSGLHLRPAGALCKEAMKYQCSIQLIFDGGSVNAKSILSVLGACVSSGDDIEISCSGEDEEEALESLVRLVNNGLGE